MNIYAYTALQIDFGNQMKTTFPPFASWSRLEANAWETQLLFQRLWTIKLTSAALWAFYFSSPRSRRYRSLSHQNSHRALVFRHCLSRTIAPLSAGAGCILREQSSHAQISLSNYLAQAKSSEVAAPMAVFLLEQSADSTWNHKSFSSKPTSLVTKLCFLQPKDRVLLDF